MELKAKHRAAFGLGAVGKDIVYMLISSYLLYYYNAVLGMSSVFIGTMMMAARIFDAFNDPLMGIVVAKTRTRWGRFRPWILAGTVLNAVTIYALYATPETMTGNAQRIWLTVFYFAWGITYTLMDIPFWSMIPAITKPGKDREGLSSLARSCSGIGDAIPTVLTMVVSVLLVYTSLNIVGNLILYFFQYDVGNTDAYSVFVAVCFAAQVIAMMSFPLLRRGLSKNRLFTAGFLVQILGFLIILVMSYTDLYHTCGWMVLCVPGALIYAGFGILNVLLTVFLSDTVDYGEYRYGNRDESVIFSMQTFTVKLGSGLAIFIAGIVLDLIHLETEAAAQSRDTLMGLRLWMTIPSVILLMLGIFVYKRFYRLDDQTLEEIIGTRGV